MKQLAEVLAAENGPPARTAIRFDFLLTCKYALGSKYGKDLIANFAF
ncbi:MAG: hypothetical protein U0930_25260 [Pirellulales bacterium]